MKKKLICVCLLISAVSCTTKKQIQYLSRANDYPDSKIIMNEYTLQPHDILKIDVHSTNTEAAIPYNKKRDFISRANNTSLQTLQLEGYLISSDYSFNFPVLGKISVKDKTTHELEAELKKELVEGQHLLNPIINIRLLNAKFTVLGEVQKPGTYSFVENRISILQALGYAGDLTIDGVRKEINLIREIDGQRKIYSIDLTNPGTMNETTFYIQSNDVIIVQPNYRKIKSAGFIGNTSSIASISSLLLSITLLLINN